MTTCTEAPLSPESEWTLRRIMLKLDIACRRRYGEDNPDERRREQRGKRATPRFAALKKIIAYLAERPNASAAEVVLATGVSKSSVQGYFRETRGPRPGSAGDRIIKAYGENPRLTTDALAEMAGVTPRYVEELLRRRRRG